MTNELTQTQRVGANVKSYRTARGMSQSDMAAQMQLCGVTTWTQATVWGIEKGTRALKFVEAPWLADVLGISLDDLLPEAERPVVVFIHAIASHDPNGWKEARCGKVWRPSIEAIALTRCPECVAITEREWSA